jgi:hypothetical protein
MAFPARNAEQAVLLALACYEFAALTTGWVPTLTKLARAHRRWLMPAAVVLLAAHIWLAPEPPPAPFSGRPEFPGSPVIPDSGGDLPAV